MPRGVALPVMKKALDKATIAAQSLSVNENAQRLQAIAAQARMTAEREAAEQLMRRQHEEKLEQSMAVIVHDQQLIDEDLHQSQIAFLNAEKNGLANSGVSITSMVENPEPTTTTKTQEVQPLIEEDLHQSQIAFLNAEKSGNVKKEPGELTPAVPSSQQVDINDELSQIRSRINSLLNEDVAA